MNFMLRQFSKISIVIKHIGSFNVTSVSNTQVQPGEHKLMVLQDITAQHRGRDLETHQRKTMSILKECCFH